MTSKLLSQAIGLSGTTGNSTNITLSSNGSLQLAANNGTDIFISANDNIGFGNTTPADKLSIQGSLYTSSNTVTFGSSLYVVANGNVGIGNSTPLKDLTVGVTNNASIYAGSAWMFDDGQVHFESKNGKDIYMNSASTLRLNHQVSGDVTLGVGGGKVGIGTSSTTEKLTVAGGVTATGTLISESSIPLRSTSTGYQYTECYSEHLAFNIKSGYSYGYYFRANDTGTAAGNNSLTYMNLYRNQCQLFSNNNLVLVTDYTNGGSVGIGTASPLAKLHVQSGSVKAGTQTSTSGSTILLGNYGDGAITTFGSEYASGGPVIGYGVTPSTSAQAAFVSSTGQTVYRAAYTITGAEHLWYTGGASSVSIGSAVTCTEKMRLSAGGYLGIGVSPTCHLHVYNTGDPIVRVESSQTGQAGQYQAVGKGSASYPGYSLYQDTTGYWSMQMRADTNLYLYRQSGTGSVYIPGGHLYLKSAGNNPASGGKLYLCGADYGDQWLGAGQITNYWMEYSGNANEGHVFRTSSVEKMIIAGSASSAKSTADAIVLNPSSGNVAIASTNASFGKLSVNGAIAAVGSYGTASLDTTIRGSGLTVANGGTVDFQGSGIISVQNWTTGHSVIWNTGGGGTSALGAIGSAYGTLAYNAGVDGYRWTNNTGSSSVFGFCYIRIRPNG